MADNMLGDILMVLANPDRRRILLSLNDEKNHGETIRVTGEDLMDTMNTRRETLKTSLYHNHLPRMDELGIIEWDKETGEIRKGERFEEVAPLLQLMDDNAEDLPEGWP